MQDLRNKTNKGKEEREREINEQTDYVEQIDDYQKADGLEDG